MNDRCTGMKLRSSQLKMITGLGVDHRNAVIVVTPTELTNKMRESRYVVTVLTSDLLSRELEWTDLALGLMLKLNKPLALVSFGQINKRILRRNRDLLTAFRVSRD